MVATTTDFGFSGTPVLNTFGAVVGMVCVSTIKRTSWILKPEYIKDTLVDVLETYP
jgi:S1-C subfamily serine protease